MKSEAASASRTASLQTSSGRPPARRAEGTPPRAASSFLLGALAAFLVLAAALSAHGFLGDIGWDVSNGLWILRHGQIPLHNYLSRAMYGAAWSNAEWLYALYAGVFFRALGPLGVYLGLLPVLALTALLLAVSAKRLGPYWDVLWPTAAALTLMEGMSPRPQLFSYLLFAFALYAVGRWREGDRRLLWIAALTSLPWTNLHGSVVLLPLVLALELLFAPRPERRALVGPLFLSVVLLAVHPGGLAGTFSNFGHVGSSGNLNTILEWASPSFHSPWTWPTLAALLLGLGFLLPAQFRARRHADAVLLLGSAAAMLYAVRFLPYLMILLALRAPDYLPPRLTLRGAPDERPAAWRSLALGVLMTLLLALPLVRGPVFPVRYPAQAFAWLKAHHAQNVFNWYPIGSTLEAYGVQPYLDGRDNLWLQRSWWPQYVAVTQGRESVLTYLRQEDPSARYVLWNVRTPVALTLDASKSWRRVVTDPNRADPEYATLGAYAVWERVGK